MPSVNIVLIPIGFVVWKRGLVVEEKANFAMYDRELNNTVCLSIGKDGQNIHKIVVKYTYCRSYIVLLVMFGSERTSVQKITLGFDKSNRIAKNIANNIVYNKPIVDMSANSTDAYAMLCGVKTVVAMHIADHDTYCVWELTLAPVGKGNASMICCNGTGKCFAVAYDNGEISVHCKTNGATLRNIFSFTTTAVRAMIDYSNVIIVAYNKNRHLTIIDCTGRDKCDKIVSCDFVTNKECEIRSIQPSIGKDIVLSCGEMGIFKLDIGTYTITRFSDAERSRGCISDAMYTHTMKKLVYVKKEEGVDIFSKSLVLQ